MKKTIKTDLFRFATIRPPQLISEAERQTHFIYHPELSGSGFYSDLNINPVWSKVEKANYLKSQADKITGIIKNVNDVRAMAPDLFKFSDWLLRNRKRQFTNLFVKQTIADAKQLDEGKLLLVWENVFYYVIKKERPYVKQALLQLLAADHFVKNFPGSSDTDLYTDFTITANAKVVMPEAVIVYKPKSYSSPGSWYDIEQAQVKFKAQQNLVKFTRYNTAVSELRKASERYNVENAQSYKTAHDEWQVQVSDLLEDAVPTDNTGPFPKYEDIDLPKFKYTPVNPVNITYLDGKISDDSIKLVFDEMEMDKYKYSSLGEVIAYIQKEAGIISRSFTAILEPSKKVMVVDGVVIDSGRPAPGPYDILYGYKICSVYTKINGTQIITLEFNAGYPEPECTALSITANCNGNIFNTTTITKTDPSAPNNLSLKLFSDPPLPSDGTGSISVYGDIKLSNGNSITIQCTFSVNTCTTGQALLKSTSNPETQNPDNIIGIKQLGLGDLRLVEQELCCYLPGEVSHIENVLKGEYKEKASRRLKRTEITDETSVETEKENLSDTSSTERNEMHSEVNRVLAQDKSFSINSSFGAQASGSFFGLFSAGSSFNINTGYASNSSQTDSDSEAVSYAKDVTTRAMERVVQKVSNRRTEKMIDEYEETIKHGFDNRGENAQNISGVYRWIDKEYRNQVVNYGKRLLYELMIPEPARFFTKNSMVQVLDKPSDFRAYISGPGDIAAANYLQLAAMYGVEVQAPPQDEVYVGKNFSVAGDFASFEKGMSYAETTTVKLPEGYYTVEASGHANCVVYPRLGNGYSITVGNANFNLLPQPQSGSNPFGHHHDSLPAVAPGSPSPPPAPLGKYINEIPAGITVVDMYSAEIGISIKLEVLPEYVDKWQLDTYNILLAAYNEKMKAYEDTIAAALSSSGAVSGITATQRRSIERTELKKNCLYLLLKTFGYPTGERTIDAGGDIVLNSTYQEHAAKVRFFEAAFDWDLMAYIFYSYFWAENAQWQNLAGQQDADPLFRAFLQAGMGKVLLSVRPGYEEAVMYYLETGDFNEGKDITIENELYMALLAELQPVQPTPVGDPWHIQLPTDLVALQADNIAVPDTGLPCACAEEGSDPYFSSNNAGLKPVLPQ